jgi:hypothetical protein
MERNSYEEVRMKGLSSWPARQKSTEFFVRWAKKQPGQALMPVMSKTMATSNQFSAMMGQL